jgi:RNA polymerase sigma factor FliA
MYTARGTIATSSLVDSCLPLVRRIAVHMMARLPPNVELDDLIQAGRIGLLQACRSFGEDGGASFTTFASKRIRGAMLDELRAMDWAPRDVRPAARRVEEAIQRLAHRLGAQPTEAEIARELQMPLDDYFALLQQIQGCQLVYADDFGQDDGDNSFLDQNTAGLRQEQRARDDPLARLLSSEFRGQLVSAIETLPAREQQVLGLYYDEELTMREIGEVLAVTESRASQLRSQALNRLRAILKPAE